MQNNIRRCSVLALLAALTSCTFCLGTDDKFSFESLSVQARKLKDVWSEGKARVKVQTEIEICKWQSRPPDAAWLRGYGLRAGGMN